MKTTLTRFRTLAKVTTVALTAGILLWSAGSAEAQLARIL